MPAERTVFLTGATGFLGARLSQALVARGDRLRCLARRPSEAGWLERLGAVLIPGEVTDEVAMAKGLAGATHAVHLAGMYDTGVVDRRTMERVNVEGTRTFLREIEKAGTARAVHISSTAALGPAAAGEGGEAADWRIPYPSCYHRTKAKAHEVAIAAQQRGLPLIIVCPAAAYGPGDRGPLARFIADLVRGRAPGLVKPPAWFSYVHVDDVVSGIVAALDRGRIGATYILSGEHASVDDFAERVAGLAGRKPPRLRMSVGPARVVGTLADTLSRLVRRRFSLSRENVELTAGLRWVHSRSRAERELDWRPRPLDEGLPETVAWFREQSKVTR